MPQQLWQRVVEGPVAEAVYRGEESTAEKAFEAELREKEAGWVAIVGAGPGDPEPAPPGARAISQRTPYFDASESGSASRVNGGTSKPCMRAWALGGQCTVVRFRECDPAHRGNSWWRMLFAPARGRYLVGGTVPASP